MDSNQQKGGPGLIQGKEKKKEKKYYGKLLILIIFVVLSIEYYQYVFEVMLGYMTQKNFRLILTLLIIFHALVLLLLMAFISTMSTNPGEIPLYWGFYIGDDDFKRKRYCLICNAFKPERSHHCSVCNKCVLNMDHHCPWVDNCIGFYNRKYFFQLLFYASIITIYFVFSAAFYVFHIVMNIINKRLKYNQIFDTGIILITYTFTLVFSFIITMFFKFHIGLVLNNSTTIESLDKEHKEENEKFNIGYYENWIQVLGNNKLLWFIPYECEAGRPVGDGLTWKIRNNDIADFNNNNNNSGPKVRNGDQAVELGNIGANNYATSPISPP
jgi:palmitoyltransferase